MILLYHRVIDTESDPFELRVTPKNFTEHLQVIRNISQPISLADLVEGIRGNTLPKRAVCVTFDDGYQDNLYTVTPLLEQYGVPATVFITTGTAGRHREFWWDQLERIFLQPGQLPAQLQLSGYNGTLRWELGKHATYSRDEMRQYQAWTLSDSDDPTIRHTILRIIHDLFLTLNKEDQDRIMDELLTWSGIPAGVRPEYRALDGDEIVKLAQRDLIEIGAHTVHHLNLPAQTLDVHRAEIYECKTTLERQLGHPILSFSYPYGFYSKNTVEIVRESGYKYACSCLPFPTRQKSNLFLLPRVDVLNWDGDGFAHYLRRQFNT